jgi:cellulose synthase operon protein C
LKLFRDSSLPRRTGFVAVTLIVMVVGWAVRGRAELPFWIRNTESGSALEQAFFRMMAMPYGNVLFRRPPSETRPALGELIRKQPSNGELYSLRALEDEQQLDFASAEADWKSYVEKSADKITALLALADFYHRRLRPQDEIAQLALIAKAPAQPQRSERFVPAVEQESWLAFERIFAVIHTQALPRDVSLATYRAWLARYSQEAQLYSRFLNYLIGEKEYAAANQLIADYQKQFPDDDIFEIKARALVEYRQGSIQQGLAVYEKGFKPLWNPELVKSYFDLLRETQNLRKFLDQAQAARAANPEDLGATARIFYYYQQQGKLDVAEQAITTLRLRKESTKSEWTPQELYTCGQLLEGIHAYPEAARYYFALYSSKGGKDSQERALSRLTDLLLTAPESPMRLGSGNLAMYQDITTLDQGPGYFNGILSLILNSAGPRSEFAEEEQRAIPYFHRARAAELLTLLDKDFPQAASRAELHAKLLTFYAESQKNDAVLASGKEFLTAFPNAPQRTAVALLMAEADARLDRRKEEFAIYDSVLQELATAAERMPLGAQSAGLDESRRRTDRFAAEQAEFSAPNSDENSDENNLGEAKSPEDKPPAAFQVNTEHAAVQGGARSAEYSRVLELYLARLAQLGLVPQALGVLRREIDHNPDDPGLYERLAVFLEQNKIGTEQEEVYRRAIARFPERSWYHKLARYYLRYHKNAEFKKLTEEVVKQFDGSELETYFQSVRAGTPQMYVQLNEYAHARFPHNPYFVRNLLQAYHYRETWNQPAWEALLREHWFEESDLRSEFFEYLSATKKLESELSTLERSEPAPSAPAWPEIAKTNPASTQFVAQANLWRSHFEDAAPILDALAAEYPADAELGRTASSVFRSLAYLDPGKTAAAVSIERNLLSVDPGNTETLARIGDIYADHERFAQASPYWERIPKVMPGETGGYLEAASIYWDYYDFENALRVLEAGRNKLGDEHLYGYEAGAIYEGQRDYVRAVHEYAAAALASGNSPALSRLLTLARRPQLREVVDQETGKLVAAARYTLPAIHLRVSVLEVQNRKAEVAELLDAAIKNASTLEQAAAIESLAQQKSLDGVRQKALEKQVVLATDPVTRLQLRYELVRLLESRKDLAGAQRNVEVLYRENPKIVGVVRATVDFYWRTKLYSQAIGVLQQAARSAYPELGRQYTFEAARKATETREFVIARNLLQPLLRENPYDGEYLAALADTYAQAGDQQGLKTLYLSEITSFRDAPFSADERKNRISALRRGLIPALTKLQDYSGAVDQYIEIINAFPEDGGLVSEAALYAARYQRRNQLLNFYAKTVKDSPRDFRWSLVLARIETGLEDLPAAIEAYGKSIAIRPDRSDLRIARAALSERLMRFDDAAGDYERIYQLTYRDPQWMEKIAEVRARQGRNDDAAAALKTALIDPAPEKAASYFTAAERLEAWGILEQARTFAEHGVSLAGGELLASAQNHQGAIVYSRIMTRLRLQDQAFATLQTAWSSASAALPIAKEQIAREGIAAISDREWREHSRQIRNESSQSGMQAAAAEIGATVARYFTPEEKVSVVAFIHGRRAGMSADQVTTAIVPLLHSAGLGAEEAAARYDALLNISANSPALSAQLQSFIELQRDRVKFAELGSQLERIAARMNPQSQVSARRAAAKAYRDAGDEDNELRVLNDLYVNNLSDEERNRYFALLLEKNQQTLVRLAASQTVWGEQAAEYVLANGSATLAQEVVVSRGRARAPVWNKSYTALVGMYFSESTPAVNQAFLDVLGDKTIGQRLGKTVDRDAQLAGNIWFYYGARYGEYLNNRKRENAADFLPAALEQSPASTAAYKTLADYYFENGDIRAAVDNYQFALQLSPTQSDLYDRLALAYYQDGRIADATAQWNLFFAVLLKQVDTVRVPESFWTDFARASDQLRTRHPFLDMQPSIDAVLRAYVHRNGTYRSAELLRSAYLASGSNAQATLWLLEISSAAPDGAALVGEIVEAEWIPLAQRGPLYKRILQAKQNDVDQAEGSAKESPRIILRSWQIRRLKNLIDLKEFQQAAELLAVVQREPVSAIPEESDGSRELALLPLELRVAAQLGTLDGKIAGYRSHPATAPDARDLRNAARALVAAGDQQSARKVLEFAFSRELNEHRLTPENFLGLAEIRIAVGDTPGAVGLLHRMLNAAGDLYEDLDSAAALLERTQHYSEAAAFLEPLANATPWQPEFRVRLAAAQMSARQNLAAAQNSDARIAADPRNIYEVRVAAASALSSALQSALPSTQPGNQPGTQHNPEFGSAELDLLAGNKKRISLSAADQPFFYDARIQAAQNSSNPQQKLQILANALADTATRDSAALPLFYSATELHADPFAFASIEQFLRHTRLNQTVPRNYSEDAGSLDSQQDETYQDVANAEDPEADAPQPQVPGPGRLSPAEQSRLGESIGQVLLRLDRFPEALAYFQVAASRERDSQRRRALAREISDVQAHLRRQQLNAARQPILHADLDQDRLVRPRILADAKPPASANDTARVTP